MLECPITGLPINDKLVKKLKASAQVTIKTLQNTLRNKLGWPAHKIQERWTKDTLIREYYTALIMKKAAQEAAASSPARSAASSPASAQMATPASRASKIVTSVTRQKVSSSVSPAHSNPTPQRSSPRQKENVSSPRQKENVAKGSSYFQTAFKIVVIIIIVLIAQAAFVAESPHADVHGLVATKEQTQKHPAAFSPTVTVVERAQESETAKARTNEERRIVADKIQAAPEWNVATGKVALAVRDTLEAHQREHEQKSKEDAQLPVSSNAKQQNVGPTDMDKVMQESCDSFYVYDCHERYPKHYDACRTKKISCGGT